MCTSAAFHLCCLATVVGLPKFCCGFLSLSSSTGEFSANSGGGFLAQALARCPAQILQPLRYGFHRNIPNWTTYFHHTKSRHGAAHCPSQCSRHSRHVFMFLPKMNWSASVWWTQHLRNWANTSGETVSQKKKMTARVKERKCSSTSVVGLPTSPVTDGGQKHHVESNVAGTTAPSTKNFLRDVSCCNSRVAVTRLLCMLCQQTMKHSAKKWSASLAPQRDTCTHTQMPMCGELNKLTATQNRTVNFQFLVDQRQTMRDTTVCFSRIPKRVATIPHGVNDGDGCCANQKHVQTCSFGDT